VYDSIVNKYNLYMGEVDAMNQMRVGYDGVDMGTRNMKWTTRFIDAMFILSATQVWVAYRYNNETVKISNSNLFDNTNDR
jgi:hypothetical protein